MYFNDEKPKPAGARFDGGKLAKKVRKSVEQLKRHDPDVEVTLEPTRFLLVSNSSVLCGVTLEELESIFVPFDASAQFLVFPNKRSYSFVECSSIDAARRARDELHGLVPVALKTSHQPFIISFVKQLPAAKKSETFRPADLAIIEEYISEELEKELVTLLTEHPSLETLKHRGVVHFGHVFDYSTNSAAEWRAAEPIPRLVEQLVDRLIADGHLTERPDQITANVYEPGHGIPSHYDTHSAFEDPIVSVSLLSDVVMEFKDGANSARIAPVLLNARSLCLIRGESRYRWKHGIVNRKYDVDPRTGRVVPRKRRVSLTLRRIRRSPCDCPWKEFCDWDRGGEMRVPETEARARHLENAYVSDVYESIADHFDETRHSTWKAVRAFLERLPPSALLYDVGCGNGKYLTPAATAYGPLVKIGCDMSQRLCEIAAAKGCHVTRADALNLPFRDASADAAISIAVLHHIATDERRRRAIRELLRVVRRGGHVCVTVWSMDQTRSEYAKMRGNKEPRDGDEARDGHNVTNDNREVIPADRLKVHDGKDFEQQDVLVPWTIDQRNETFLRYYHVFRDGEVEHLVASIDNCRLVSNVKEQGNYVFVVEKIF